MSEGISAALGVPVLAGRDFTTGDTDKAAPVIVINKALADALWPREDPIGKYIVGPCAPERRVVGVLGNVRHLSLEQPSGNEMYIPARQCDDLAGAYLVVRSSLPPAQIAGTLRAVLVGIAPNLASNDFRTLQQIVDRSVSPRRFTVILLGGFAVFALVLASLGIYALISYWLLGRGAAALLYGVTPRDPETFAAMVFALVAVALVAGYLPARRASRIDPVVALRAE